MGHLGKFAVVLVGRAATTNRPFNNYMYLVAKPFIWIEAESSLL